MCDSNTYLTADAGPRSPSEIRARLSADGFCFPMQAFSEAEAASVLNDYLQFGAKIALNPVLSALNGIFKPHLISMWADQVAHCPAILDAVETALGPNLVLWSVDVFVRRAESRRAADSNSHAPERGDQIGAMGLEWHQDSLYLGLEPLDEIVRVWLALTPTTVKNGTMRYLRASHKHGTVRHTGDENPLSYNEKGPRVELEIDEADAVPVILSPGQFAMHSITTVHDSGVNRTEDDRVAVSMTFLSGRVRAKSRCTVMVVRGSLTHDDYDLEPRPKRDLAADSVEFFLKALQARLVHMQRMGVPDVRRLAV